MNPFYTILKAIAVVFWTPIIVIILIKSISGEPGLLSRFLSWLGENIFDFLDYYFPPLLSGIFYWPWILFPILCFTFLVLAVGYVVMIFNRKSCPPELRAPQPVRILGFLPLVLFFFLFAALLYYIMKLY